MPSRRPLSWEVRRLQRDLLVGSAPAPSYKTCVRALPHAPLHLAPWTVSAFPFEAAQNTHLSFFPGGPSDTGDSCQPPLPHMNETFFRHSVHNTDSHTLLSYPSVGRVPARSLKINPYGISCSKSILFFVRRPGGRAAESTQPSKPTAWMQA